MCIVHLCTATRFNEVQLVANQISVSFFRELMKSYDSNTAGCSLQLAACTGSLLSSNASMPLIA